MRIRWYSCFKDAQIEIEVPSVDQSAEANIQLEQIFRALNCVDGSNVEVVPSDWPSMTGGDIVWLGDQAYWCAPVGWIPHNDSEMLTEYMKLDQRDRPFVAPWKEDGEWIRKWGAVNKFCSPEKKDTITIPVLNENARKIPEGALEFIEENGGKVIRKD